MRSFQTRPDKFSGGTPSKISVQCGAPSKRSFRQRPSLEKKCSGGAPSKRSVQRGDPSKRSVMRCLVRRIEVYVPTKGSFRATRARRRSPEKKCSDGALSKRRVFERRSLEKCSGGTPLKRSVGAPSKRSVWEALGGAPSKRSVRAALLFKGVFGRRSLEKGSIWAAALSRKEVFGRRSLENRVFGRRSLEKKRSSGAPWKRTALLGKGVSKGSTARTLFSERAPPEHSFFEGAPPERFFSRERCRPNAPFSRERHPNTAPQRRCGGRKRVGEGSRASPPRTSSNGATPALDGRRDGRGRPRPRAPREPAVARASSTSHNVAAPSPSPSPSPNLDVRSSIPREEAFGRRPLERGVRRHPIKRIEGELKRRSLDWKCSGGAPSKRSVRAALT